MSSASESLRRFRHAVGIKPKRRRFWVCRDERLSHVWRRWEFPGDGRAKNNRLPYARCSPAGQFDGERRPAFRAIRERQTTSMELDQGLGHVQAESDARVLTGR